jgi:hypothetical protein
MTMQINYELTSFIFAAIGFLLCVWCVILHNKIENLKDEISMLEYVQISLRKKLNATNAHKASLTNQVKSLKRKLEAKAIPKKPTHELQYPNNTVGFWLSQIEDETIRKKALKNTKFNMGTYCKSIANALSFGFDFNTSKEGLNYWENVRAKYLK